MTRLTLLLHFSPTPFFSALMLTSDIGSLVPAFFLRCHSFSPRYFEILPHAPRRQYLSTELTAHHTVFFFKLVKILKITDICGFLFVPDTRLRNTLDLPCLPACCHIHTHCHFDRFIFLEHPFCNASLFFHFILIPASVTICSTFTTLQPHTSYCHSYALYLNPPQLFTLLYILFPVT